MRFLLILILSILPLSAKDSPEAILKTLPGTLAGCTKGEFHKYDEAELGGSVAYKVPGLVVTVYAFDLGTREIADGLDDKVVQEAFKQAKAELELAKERGLYSELETITPPRARTEAGTLCAFYHLKRAQEPDKGLPMFSEIHVFGAQNHIIKLRVSGDRGDQKQLGGIVEKLVPAIRKEFQKAGKTGPKETR